ncbi:hypothetical protein YC2023_118874 [Brassica napus]
MQDSQESSESMDSSGTINGQDSGDLDEQDPSDNNEFLNYAWLYNIAIPDNLYPQVLNIEECMPLVVDAALARWFSAEGLVRLFHVARMCLDQEVVARPTMRFVELMVRHAADYEALEWLPVTKRSSI